MQWDPELCFSFESDSNSFAILFKIGSFERDKEGVEVGFHWKFSVGRLQGSVMASEMLIEPGFGSAF